MKTPGAPTSKLAPLSPRYIVQRKRMDLHPDTAPAVSNLTQTGAMLDALRVRVSEGRVSVYIGTGKELDKAMYTNEQRPWVNISKGEATRLREFIEKLVRQKL